MKAKSTSQYQRKRPKRQEVDIDPILNVRIPERRIARKQLNSRPNAVQFRDIEMRDQNQEVDLEHKNDEEEKLPK